MHRQLIEQACGGSRRKVRRGRKVRASSLPLALRWWRVLATRTTHLQSCLHLQRSRHAPPTDHRASLWLLHGARPEADARCVPRLCPRHFGGGECLPPGPRTCIVVWPLQRSRNAPPTDRASLWLLHGARPEAEARCVPRLCRRHFGGGECLPPGPRTCTVVWPLQRSCNAPPSDWLSKLVAAARCKVEADARCVPRLCRLPSGGGACLLP